jgi:hypothetical protein
MPLFDGPLGELPQPIDSPPSKRQLVSTKMVGPHTAGHTTLPGTTHVELAGISDAADHRPAFDHVGRRFRRPIPSGVSGAT